MNISLKLGGTNYHFNWVKVPGIALIERPHTYIHELVCGVENMMLQASVRGCHRERGWNQQIMMLENGRLYHSMYLGIL
jgi:hypothetical protein